MIAFFQAIHDPYLSDIYEESLVSFGLTVKINPKLTIKGAFVYERSYLYVFNREVERI
jgi:hypothetical protein